MEEETSEFSADQYFSTQPAPATLDADVHGVREFIEFHMAKGHRVVLVTSGGTTVPLELNVVRFLDNFSAGTRGATSAEYFLRSGYAVIFMHRQFSLQPFSRHYSHTTNPFLDFLDVADYSDPNCTDVVVKPNGHEFLAQVLRARHDALKNNMLHTVTFVTVNEYLFLLRAVSVEMARLRRRSMYYLAAAVSDFFLPRQKLSEHKIQSKKGSLHIEMDQVPKVLKPMVEHWIPESYVVSFKLETDPQLLIPKARAALERYGHQVVVANMLTTRKFEVAFVSTTLGSSNSTTAATPTSGSSAEASTAFTEEWVRLPGSWVEGAKGGHSHDHPTDHSASKQPPAEIEEIIVEKLVAMHEAWIAHPTLSESAA